MMRPRAALAAEPDYESRTAQWTIEELRAFAAQLQLPDAALKSRYELIELLGGPDLLGDPRRYQ